MTAAVLVRRPVPDTDGELEVAGLDASVEVIRDDHGIAQIYADTDDDLMRAQGFVAAQDRFFEMDVRRHVTAGRLAELFGEDGLETDKYIRTMGWRRVAEQEWALLDPETRDALTAYAEGVNAYLDQRGDLRDRGGVHHPRARPGSTTSRSRGCRPTRWPGSRRWRGTCAATWTTRSPG